MKYLRIKIKSVLMSFGKPNYWLDRKETYYKPTKSSLIGLFGAALGIPRNHSLLKELDSNITFYLDTKNSKGIVPMSILEDYQTATPDKYISFKELVQNDFNVPKEGKRFTTANGGAHAMITPTIKEYIQNGVFVVYAYAEDNIIDEISEAIDEPFYPLYFGRKCCIPSCRINDGVFEKLPQDSDKQAFAVLR